MSNYYSVCSGLEIAPLERVARYWQEGIRAGVVIAGGKFSPDAIPGSIATSCKQTETGTWKVEISFDTIIDDIDLRDYLQRIAAADLIARYRDQRGCDRLAGSPQYPLSLTLECDGARVKGKLTGESTEPDPYLV